MGCQMIALWCQSSHGLQVMNSNEDNFKQLSNDRATRVSPMGLSCYSDNLSGDPLQQDECLYFPQPCFLLYLRAEKETNLMTGNLGWVSISGTGRTCLVRSTIRYWASPVHGAAAMLINGQLSPYLLNPLVLWWKGLGWDVCAQPH